MISSAKCLKRFSGKFKAMTFYSLATCYNIFCSLGEDLGSSLTSF